MQIAHDSHENLFVNLQGLLVTHHVCSAALTHAESLRHHLYPVKVSGNKGKGDAVLKDPGEGLRVRINCPAARWAIGLTWYKAAWLYSCNM